MRLSVIAFSLLALLLAACTGGMGSMDHAAGAGTNDARSQLGPDPAIAMPDAAGTSIEQQLPAPDGVDGRLWEQLTAELERVLAANPPAPRMPLRPAIKRVCRDSRQVSFTPYGEHNRVSDLHVNGTGPYRLTWHYRNSGDYDLNGQVNVADLVPIGRYFSVSTGQPIWLNAIVADGDGNGVINVSDITPLGVNFGGCIIGYRLYATDDVAGEWNYLGSATVEANLHGNTDQPFFMIVLEQLDYEYYALWPYDNSDDDGGWSNTTSLSLSNPRKIKGVQRLWPVAQ